MRFEESLALPVGHRVDCVIVMLPGYVTLRRLGCHYASLPGIAHACGKGDVPWLKQDN